MNNYLTEAAINKLKEEIEYRKIVVRHRILEEVKEARAHGDLSENFEYKAAKRERGINESRIRYLERMVRTAKIVTESTNENEAGIGKNVYVLFEGETQPEMFSIVTTIETDPMNNKISIESPLGRAINKKTVGDTVMVDSPEGSYNVVIHKIEFMNTK